jgi:hypothetical protein
MSTRMPLQKGSTKSATFRCAKPVNNDPFAGEIERHPRMGRLSSNLAFFTKLLDQDIISVFKRHFLEMLSDKPTTKGCTNGENITKGTKISLVRSLKRHRRKFECRVDYRLSKFSCTKDLPS